MKEGDKAYLDANATAAKILQQKYPIKSIGTGVGDNNGIEMMALSFRVTGQVDVSYARDFLIKITNDYINILNSIPNLRPFMKKYPFDEKNVEITLYFHQKNGYEAFHPYVAIAAATRGDVYFHTVEKENKFKYKESHFESYEEALEKLKFKGS